MVRDTTSRSWRTVAAAGQRPRLHDPPQVDGDRRRPAEDGEGEAAEGTEQVPTGENLGGVDADDTGTADAVEPVDPWADFYRGREQQPEPTAWRDDDWSGTASWKDGWHDWRPAATDRRASATSASTGCLTDRQVGNFYTTAIGETTATDHGRWVGTRRWEPNQADAWDLGDGAGDGWRSEGRDSRGLRGQVLRAPSAGLAPVHQASGAPKRIGAVLLFEREGLDLRRRAGRRHFGFLEWIQARFMEMEVSKISQMMTHLFKRCKRRQDQPVREFNVEFERLVLRLREVKCELPPLVKAWLYLDKLRLSEGEGKARPRPAVAEGAIAEANGAGAEDSDDVLVDEVTAAEHHTAFVAYQAAKEKYREAIKGRGTDPGGLKRRSEECLRQAKARSYCGACKRRGHWHKDPECPLRGRGRAADAQMCNQVFMITNADELDEEAPSYPTATVEDDHDYKNFGADGGEKGRTIKAQGCPVWLAGSGPAPHQPRGDAVAGYQWFEDYCRLMDGLGVAVWTRDHFDSFKFGASRVHVSKFAVLAWFAIQGKWFLADIAIVPCEVSQYPAEGPPLAKVPEFDVIWCPSACAYMSSAMPLPLSSSQATPLPPKALKNMFYPKKVAPEVHNMLAGAWACGGHAFSAWWKGANQSKDFWLETEGEMVRVHVIPRKRPFDPNLWTTKHDNLKDDLPRRLGAERVTEAIPCLVEGIAVQQHSSAWRQSDSEGLCLELRELSKIGLWVGRSRFPKQLSSNPQFENLMSSLKSPWKMNKRELTLELEDYEVLIHATWTVPELRSMVIEQRQARELTSKKGRGEGDPMAGLSKMTLAQLIEEAQKQGVALPTQPTKGVIMRLLMRDATTTEATTIMPFGKYKNWYYKEVPVA
ncbi:ND5 [Symbiodinium sp. CCMP2592]|nr:ND5 [Symbiodinium sp. CCMP2592]